VHVRGEYLPVLKSHEIFNIQPQPADMGLGIMVILESDGVKKALFVDELVGQHQVVIKSLESNYRRIRGVSGATIMGDGKVALIIDAGVLVRGIKPELRAAA
jgi:two-component system chemotaxis sensor kinase CheA